MCVVNPSPFRQAAASSSMHASPGLRGARGGGAGGEPAPFDLLNAAPGGWWAGRVARAPQVCIY